MIKRMLETKICEHLRQNKAILIFGARQVGKTTLLENLSCLKSAKVLYLSGDEADIREMLTDTTSTQLQYIFGDHEVVVIDEAQQIQNIGTTLKLITDKLKHIQVIATGSSAFELANKANEPLTGRKFEFQMFPLTFAEMIDFHGFITENRMLEQRLIYGYYPEIINNPTNEEKYLKLIANSYLYKDLLILDNIKNADLLHKILKALALQVGSEVSYNEIAQLCKTDYKTVEKYVDLFEKSYITFKLPALSKNVRNEIKKGKKIYFYDNGIRNAVIGNFTKLGQRTDTGALWENFLISERIKQNSYKQRAVTTYFWRTTQQQEIDFIEEQNGKFYTFEFKWNDKKKAILSKTFEKAYPNVEFQNINRDNYMEFFS